MWIWVIVIIIAILSFIFVFLKDLITAILNNILYIIKILFGGSNGFNKFMMKLIACAVVIAIGCAVLLRICDWQWLETAIQACMIFIVLVITIMPIKNTFSAMRSFDDYSFRIIGCAITIALGCGALYWLYSWEFLEMVLQYCGVAVVFLFVVTLIKGIFS